MMAENTELIEKRDEIKRMLAPSNYKAPGYVVSDKIGYIIQKLLRSSKPLPFWYNALIITLLILLANFSTSIFLGEFYPLRRSMISFEISLAGLILSIVIGGKIYLDIIFNTLRNHILDAIESVANLNNLELWLAAIFDVKRTLFFSLVYGILSGIYYPIFFATVRGGFVGFGSIVEATILAIVAGMAVYYLFLFLALPLRLSRYQFKLYDVNPSKSEVIDRLSDMLNNSVYIGVVPATIGTLIAAYFGLLTSSTIIILVLGVWGPLTAFFVISQYASNKIIANAKWKKLNEIQAKIETLETQDDIPSGETLEHLGKLMDYHDRIEATPNSALNLRAGLNFLNSLLLPLFAFIIANFDTILAYFT